MVSHPMTPKSGIKITRRRVNFTNPKGLEIVPKRGRKKGWRILQAKVQGGMKSLRPYL